MQKSQKSKSSDTNNLMTDEDFDEVLIGIDSIVNHEPVVQEKAKVSVLKQKRETIKGEVDVELAKDFEISPPK